MWKQHCHNTLLLPPLPQLVSPNATILDVDTSDASSLVLTIPTILSGDEFMFPPPTSSISMQEEINGTARLITYSGRQPLAIYIDLLFQFQYTNMLPEPQPGIRRVTAQVFTPSDDVGTLLGSNIAEITIEVLPTNDNSPVFDQSSYNGSVSENEPSGSSTGVTVSASDADVGGSVDITYRIDGNNLDFAVDPVSGVITTLRPLDADVSGYRHQITVIADDNDGPSIRSASVIVTIEVLDQNDITPVFAEASYNITVREDVTLGSNISTNVVAQDTDRTPANSAITYRLQEPEGTVGSGAPLGSALGPIQASLPFTVDPITGALATTETLDFETTLEYSFTVLAVDSGTPSLTGTTQVRVIIQDVNDNSPEFVGLPYSVTLAESTAISTTVFTVRATDADATTNGQIQYSLEGTDRFTINATTGEIVLVQSLDHESVQNISFTVVATDLGQTRPLSSVAQVFVTTSNVNDNPPSFSPPFVFTVLENSALQEQLTASDPDGDQLSFQLSSANSTGIFEVDRLSGELTSVAGFTFDFESQQTYLVIVEVSDGVFNVSASITINVIDVNDLSPVFSQQLYNVSISEALPVGSTLTRVVAADGDTGTNAEIEYSILEGNMGNAFGIDPQSGSVTVAAALDFDSPPIAYTLTVLARNPAPPYLNATATVMVFLTDANDVEPMLTLDPLNITYVENSGQVLIAAGIRVIDQDSSAHPVTQCSVNLLRGECGLSGTELTQACGNSSACVERCAESIAVDDTLIGGLSLSSTDTNASQIIAIFGNAPELTYQQILATLVYSNLAGEPVPGTRTVEIRCEDGVNVSNTLQVAVSVELRNEFCVDVSTTQNAFSYTEEMGGLAIGLIAEFTLSDDDRTPHNAVSQIDITLSNRLDEASETLSVTQVPGVTVMNEDGDAPVISDPQAGEGVFANTMTLEITGPASLEAFTQVLQSLVFNHNHAEPTLGQRRITITPVDGTLSCDSIELTITIVPVNDNAPDLFLNVTNFVRYEEESGSVLFAAEAGLQIEDLDHNHLFGMEGANVTLGGARDLGSEVLGYSDGLRPASVSVSSEVGGEGCVCAGTVGVWVCVCVCVCVCGIRFHVFPCVEV